MKRIVLSIILVLFHSVPAHARETYFEEGAMFAGSIGWAVSDIVLLTAVDCDPASRKYCPGGRAVASLVWGLAAGAAGVLIGGGIGALVTKPQYEVRFSPVLDDGRFGMQLMSRW